MITKYHWLGVGLVALVLSAMLLAACAPKATPPLRAPAPSSVQPTAAPQAAPKASQQPSAWDQTVAAARKEGTVTVYGSAFVADIARRVSRDFEKQYGIRVEMLAGSGNQLLEKVKVEQKIGQPIADIMGSSGGSVTQLVLEGLTVGTAKDLPELRNKDNFLGDPMYSPGGELIIFAWDVTPSIINTNLIKPQDEPKSWYDYLNPKWKGHILSPDPTATGSTAFYYTLRFFKVTDLDYLRGMAKQEMAMWKGNNREGIRMVARGEYWIYLFGPMDGIAPLAAEGAPIKGLAMKEGDVFSGRLVAQVKNAPHPNAAKVFLNWLLTPEGQVAFHEEAKITPFRKGIPDFAIPQARLPGVKPIARTWASEEWADKDMKAGTLLQIFGSK